MIIVDDALRAREAQGRPIRVGMIGAGFMGHGLTNQIVNSVPGMRLVAIYNRHVPKAISAFKYSGSDLEPAIADTQEALEDAIRTRRPAVTEDADAAGAFRRISTCWWRRPVRWSSAPRVIMEAFKHGKDVVLLNAEIDATIGPILQVYAAKHGVVLSACDGDEPGVQINLYRWVRGLGLTPRVIGNIKGLQDPYRTPTTQKGFAEKWGQNPAMVTSFADGSKISFEQAIVANATGFVVKSRGMSRGMEYRDDVMTIRRLYDIDELRSLGGIVDYVVGTPLTKVYCLAEHTDPKQRHYLSLYKMGDGPLYCVLHSRIISCTSKCRTPSRARCCFAIPLPGRSAGPVVEVCAVAKRDLKAGEILDEYGNYMTYGEAVNADEMQRERYLPEGLVEGCKLRRDIRKDAVLTYDDVELPPGRLADQLRQQQYERFAQQQTSRLASVS